MDYALKLGGKARLLLEAKALGKSLDDEKCLVQTVTYATRSGVSWCLISNGEEYRIYNANARVAADEKMLCKVSLTQTDPETAARILSLVSRETFEEEELERHWRLHSVDRDVDRLLREWTSKPDRALVNLIQSRLSSYPVKDVEESLGRPDGQIEFGGKSFDSPSSAGTAAKEKATGIARATNGWAFWRFAGPDGRPRFLLDARDSVNQRPRSGAVAGE